jgi:phage-related protein
MCFNIITNVSKQITFLGSSLKDIKAFPEEARKTAGTELRRVQDGDDPTDWKPMNTVGQGVKEVRIKEGGAFRVFYLAQLEESIYVIHAFQKKSGKTSKPDMELGQTRFKQLMRGK